MRGYVQFLVVIIMLMRVKLGIYTWPSRIAATFRLCQHQILEAEKSLGILNSYHIDIIPQYQCTQSVDPQSLPGFSWPLSGDLVKSSIIYKDVPQSKINIDRPSVHLPLCSRCNLNHTDTTAEQRGMLQDHQMKDS